MFCESANCHNNNNNANTCIARLKKFLKCTHKIVLSLKMFKIVLRSFVNLGQDSQNAKRLGTINAWFQCALSLAFAGLHQS